MAISGSSFFVPVLLSSCRTVLAVMPRHYGQAGYLDPFSEALRCLLLGWGHWPHVHAGLTSLRVASFQLARWSHTFAHEGDWCLQFMAMTYWRLRTVCNSNGQRQALKRLCRRVMRSEASPGAPAAAETALQLLELHSMGLEDVGV